MGELEKVRRLRLLSDKGSVSSARVREWEREWERVRERVREFDEWWIRGLAALYHRNLHQAQSFSCRKSMLRFIDFGLVDVFYRISICTKRRTRDSVKIDRQIPEDKLTYDEAVRVSQQEA